MIIYPTLEIMDGKCVSLTRGRLEEPVIWHVDPVEQARRYAAAGAQWMHLTDIDGLKGDDSNAELCEEIIRTVGIPVQFGGGFRTREQVERWIDKGAGRIVLSTLAVFDPDQMHALAKFYPDQIVLALDVFDGAVMTDGWRSRSSFTPETFITAFERAPLAGIVVTDIDADIADRDASLGVITGLAAATRHPVIARGTIHGIDDVARLKYVKNVAGTLIGRALLARDVDLSEALAIASAPTEPVAEFQ
ncbi:1-(5-phosphoribosyl)-5-[(5-phosphoribosylamino)methylideneamino] imidazole-4-carboxamide isomerase [Roseovarius spongiae]|uniref:1-(5-phosphoribosyl)-5-[(5-phosphoribosylamino)methylideneamino] imidazole-4-carboxamide isomerase n=1 Tax=Roseovarius spongiae TaxID=2320272 RepID=A0A3A8AVY8_9RHOB|nr:1-(5-phosphoribosyl)-5-[(5-phosphoribosylamino)methylideneamino] imidazole-4-carboxamide isomerase [Roseovarius spongiae]RKF14780.1 1-(5-phosphoribosyl)-5-[(5-phosphoribosylamino)methylideneamino] imidazole-4-carboxamide isomerase [Roseovarius spongiae]